MATLLHVDSSPIGEASITRELTREFVRRWRDANPRGRVIERDLAKIAIPVIDEAWIAANLTAHEARTPEQREILRLSAELVRELLAADEYVMGIPMHNCGPSAAFKLWVDHIVTPLGRSAPLDGKRVTFLIATGSPYRPGTENACKYLLEAWLRNLFGYLGIRDMRFIIAGSAAAVRHRTVDRTAFLQPHIAAMDELFPGAGAPAPPAFISASPGRTG
ncbi:MAG TPA: NAD(P)H-dependent oxidoreductase [Verrucomicrobiae bacterium]|nr:NAD(P)H-dependent oxidoreductase [Verrucomicrobiae bacterium]